MIRAMGRSKLVWIALAVVAAMVWVGLRTTVLSDLGNESGELEERAEPSEPLATLRVIEGDVEVAADGDAYKPTEAEVEMSAGSGVRTGPAALAEIEYFDGSLT